MEDRAPRAKIAVESLFEKLRFPKQFDFNFENYSSVFEINGYQDKFTKRNFSHKK